MSTAELPHDIDAEKATLGSVLLNRDALPPLVNWLKPEMFYLERHAQIYSAMLELHNRRVPTDVRTLTGALRDRGVAEDTMYVLELSESVPTSYHVEYYAKIVQRHWRRRQALEIGGKIAALAHNETDDAVISDGIQSLVSKYVLGDTRGGLVSIGEVMASVKEWYLRDEDPGVMTSLYDYDRATGGLRPGQLIVLAGRPGQGKSAFAGTIACNIAQDGGRVVYFSMEMDRVEMGIRILSMNTGIDGALLQDRMVQDEDLQAAWAAMPQIAEWPMHFEDVTVSLSDIRARVMQHIMKFGPIACVVVDYIQLVKPDNRYKGNRELEVAAIARGLKELAQEAKTAIVALSQLNRDIEKRSKDSLHPTLSDLRESGEIEQAANQVTFVVNPKKFGLDTIELEGNQVNTEALGLLFIEKQRGRPNNIVQLRFNAPCTRFENLERFRAIEGY
jgi:replicative DNA helicase